MDGLFLVREDMLGISEKVICASGKGSSDIDAWACVEAIIFSKEPQRIDQFPLATRSTAVLMSLKKRFTLSTQS